MYLCSMQRIGLRTLRSNTVILKIPMAMASPICVPRCHGGEFERVSFPMLAPPLCQSLSHGKTKHQSLFKMICRDYWMRGALYKTTIAPPQIRFPVVKGTTQRVGLIADVTEINIDNTGSTAIIVGIGHQIGIIVRGEEVAVVAPVRADGTKIRETGVMSERRTDVNIGTMIEMRGIIIEGETSGDTVTHLTIGVIALDENITDGSFSFALMLISRTTCTQGVVGQKHAITEIDYPIIFLDALLFLLLFILTTIYSDCLPLLQSISVLSTTIII